MEEYGGDSRENCNASRKLDNFVPRQQEGGDGCLHSKFKASCKYARDITMSKSRWEGKLVEFLTKNATNWDPEVIPPEVAGRIFFKGQRRGRESPTCDSFHSNLAPKPARGECYNRAYKDYMALSNKEHQSWAGRIS
jgi:hypothetical protein